MKPGPVTPPDPAGTAIDGTAIRATRIPFVLYLLFMVSWFIHLPERVPAIGLVRIDLLLVALIASLIVLGTSAASTKAGWTNRLILLLITYAVVTAPFVQWPGSVLKVGLPAFAKAVVFYYFTSRLVLTERRLAQLLLVFVACQSFRVLEPVYLHVTEGYWGSAASMLGGAEMMPRLSGAPSDVINPNGLAFVVVSTIPFLHHVWTLRWPGTLAYVLVLPILLYALALTGSRSGLVGLTITFAAIWVRSRQKALLATLGFTAILLAVPFLSADQKDRYSSIFSSDTKNAATAHARVEGISADFQVAMRRPLLGYGLGTSREANTHFGGRALPSHNLVTQVLQELGIIGLLIFSGLIGTIFLNVRRALRHFREAPGSSRLLLRLSLALEVWLVMNILNSVFTYGLSSYEWYFIAGLAEVLTRLSNSAPAAVRVSGPAVAVLGHTPARVRALTTAG